MNLDIRKSEKTGFCFGVNKAIETLEKAALERGKIEPLGDVVHNRQAMERLEKLGVKVAASLDDIEGTTVAIGAHGVSPEVESKIQERFSDVIDTTCSFVKRAQNAARKLAEAGFFLIVYGDRNHVEVKGILGWSGGNGIATLDTEEVTRIDPLPKKIGILSQTTQIPAGFNEFVKKLIDLTLAKDSELRVMDTICHDIRDRQDAAVELANQVDLMFVVGSQTSANTKHLARLCATITQTVMIETADDITRSMLDSYTRIGVTGGASTSESTITEVLKKLESF